MVKEIDISVLLKNSNIKKELLTGISFGHQMALKAKCDLIQYPEALVIKCNRSILITSSFWKGLLEDDVKSVILSNHGTPSNIVSNWVSLVGASHQTTIEFNKAKLCILDDFNNRTKSERFCDWVIQVLKFK